MNVQIEGTFIATCWRSCFSFSFDINHFDWKHTTKNFCRWQQKYEETSKNFGSNRQFFQKIWSLKQKVSLLLQYRNIVLNLHPCGFKFLNLSIRSYLFLCFRRSAWYPRGSEKITFIGLRRLTVGLYSPHGILYGDAVSS